MHAETQKHVSNQKLVTQRQAIPQTPSVFQAVLSDQPISVDVAIKAVESDTSGAVVSFSGVVRNHDRDKDVDRLSYTAHPSAQQVLEDVVKRVAAEFSLPGGLDSRAAVQIWAAHRIGALRIGDPALVCAVAAGHRAEAFAICSDLVDRIKKEVPIWKEQFFSDGTVEWVGAGG
ncbi:molybdenum cofactor biosynthesis protein MoaE [Paenarthrobacter sp. TA1.8]|uniref:molybdenum cofactor biosynthesis protein MoaE n=1 Tax=Paenarthrobacter sp. TA1.8 TaxID=3400219 RepID=UPI003B43A7C0